MADTNVNYVNPSSLSEIATRMQQSGTPDAPNTSPLAGYLQGQSYSKMMPFVDLAQKQQEMANQTQSINLQDLQQQQPSRNFAAISKNNAEGTTGQLNTMQNQFAMGRVATDDQVKKLAQQNDIQEQTRKLGIDHLRDMASAHDAIADKLGPNGEITPEANQAYQAYLQNRNPLVGKSDQIDEKHHNWNLTPQIATRMKVAKTMIENQQEILGQKGLESEKRVTQLVVGGQEIASRENISSADRKARADIAGMERASAEKVAGWQTTQERLKGEAADAMEKYEAAYQKWGDAQTAINRLEPRERALIQDDVFHRLFPTYGMNTVSQVGTAQSNKMSGIMQGATNYQNYGGDQSHIPPSNFNRPQPGAGATVAPQGQPPQGGNQPRIAPPQGVGEIRQFKEGQFQWNGKQWVPVRQ